MKTVLHPLPVVDDVLYVAVIKLHNNFHNFIHTLKITVDFDDEKH